ncbi:alpha-hydroxy acid oxidase [uncultured Cocleimonas sp.]|uniref:alpha-hydroxy acid oxidase n=1 Tax=uncultured Cocleimonas sp. TaxID=1051587 RepID=UPI0026283339|nr:alpha-hydroxy acid oxidase [uncultured Cocleimonas sp.]
MKKKLESIPANLVSVQDYESLFADFIPHPVYEYIAGGSADDISLKNNRNAFDSILLNRRVLADFSAASTRTEVLGKTVKYPIMLAPVAHQKLVHPKGEIATAEAANVLDLGFIGSTLSSVPMEDVADALQGEKWFQLYFQESRDATLSLIQRAENAGYGAIVVTVDAAINGLRNRVQRAGFALPAGMEANLVNYQRPPLMSIEADQSIILNGIMRDAPTWQDIQWIQTQTSLPVILKGITHSEDAKIAKELGVAGIVVSNHGGRTLDSVPAAIDVLADIRATVGDDFTVLFDSGIRRGSDIFKALALGADSVLIGRPQLYGLSIAGALGVAHILKLLIEEFEVTMALMGCATIDQITQDTLYSKQSI